MRHWRRENKKHWSAVGGNELRDVVNNENYRCSVLSLGWLIDKWLITSLWADRSFSVYTSLTLHSDYGISGSTVAYCQSTHTIVGEDSGPVNVMRRLSIRCRVFQSIRLFNSRDHPRINLSPKRSRKKRSKQSPLTVKSRHTRPLPCLFTLEDIGRRFGASHVTSYAFLEGGLGEIFNGTIKQGAEGVAKGEHFATNARKLTMAPSARPEYGATEVGQHLDVHQLEFVPMSGPRWDNET